LPDYYRASIIRKQDHSRRLLMATAKDIMVKTIQDLPDDASFEEILKQLSFTIMVKKGLDDSDEGKTISHDEMLQRVKSWQP
jgi:predicted transcriptional regulator